MTLHILLLADIHGNYPALRAVADTLEADRFDHIVNCGDSLVYAPFANETLAWLEEHRALSILGNTDRKVKRLLTGHTLTKPGKADKRVMYTSTAATLQQQQRAYLLSLPKSAHLALPGVERGRKHRIGVFHGSPADPEEFLFADTPTERFDQLALASKSSIIVSGHSHAPYHRVHRGIHFINPGSVGRMFDGDPRASCATLELGDRGVVVHHHRITYDIAETVTRLAEQGLPEIYAEMFKKGKKLN